MAKIQFENGIEVEFEGNPTEADIEEVAKKVGVQAPAQPKKESLLKSLVTEPAKLFTQFGKRTGEAIATATVRPFLNDEKKARFDQAVTEDVDVPLLGTLKGQKPFGEGGGKQILGEAATTASYLYGGPGTTQTFKTGLKGLIGQGFKEGVKTGAIEGSLYSFGDAIQQAENSPSDVAYQTLFGGALGGATGGIFGAGTPLVAKWSKEIRKFANVNELENKIANTYKKTLNPTSRQIKVDSRFGGDSFKFLSQEMPDLPLDVNKDGRLVLDDAIDMAKQKYIAEATAFKAIIRNSGKYTDIDEVIKVAKAKAKQEFDGSDLIKAEKQIEDEVNAFLANSPQDVNVTANGKRFIPLDRADDIKTYSWSRGKGWGSPDAEVWNDTNNLIGHALKDAIEKELPDAPVKAMNKRLGQWKNAIDMLERRNAQVSGSGGKLSKYLIRSVGTSIGAGLGTGDEGIVDNIVGGYGGFMTASILASVMSNPKIRLYVVRKILKNLNNAGRQDMIREAEQILQEQANKYLLPSAGQSSYVEPAINLPRSVRETNLGLDELRGQSMPKNLQQQAPKAPPTIAPTINSNIEKNQIKATIANKPADNNKTSSLINKTVPEKKGFIKSIVDKYKNLPNKQGGFAKFGSDVKISVSPESVSKKLSFEDKEIINRILNRKTLGTEIATSDFLKQLGIDKLEPELRDRFLREALDLSNKLSFSKSKSSITPTRGQGGKFNGSVSKLK